MIQSRRKPFWSLISMNICFQLHFVHQLSNCFTHTNTCFANTLYYSKETSIWCENLYIHMYIHTHTYKDEDAKCFLCQYNMLQGCSWHCYKSREMGGLVHAYSGSCDKCNSSCHWHLWLLVSCVWSMWYVGMVIPRAFNLPSFSHISNDYIYIRRISTQM